MKNRFHNKDMKASGRQYRENQWEEGWRQERILGLSMI
jgi:hypothetical protein